MGKIRLGIVASQFNRQITSQMKSEAIMEAKRQGAEIAEVVEVPGAYEIPFAAKLLAAKKGIDAIATVGAVIKGETNHDEAIMHAICSQLLSLSISSGKPIGLGISGPGQTEIQAKERAHDYARRSVQAAISMCRLKMELQGKPSKQAKRAHK